MQVQDITQDITLAPLDERYERYENTSIVARIREAVAATPVAPAIICDGRVVTYSELESRSNAIAHLILESVGSDTTPVATLVRHDEVGLITLLGIMKTGRPFAQLDPLLPSDRIMAMLKISTPAMLVTDKADPLILEKLGSPGCQVKSVGDAWASVPPKTAPTSGEDVTAILFTSGSTGAPKGVVWRHSLLMCEAWSGCQAMDFAPTDRMALVLPFSFAAGLGVAVWGLCSGAAVHVFDPRVRGIRATLSWLIDEGITTIHTTPALLRQLLGTLEPGQLLADLRLVATCAEPVHGREVAALRKHLTDAAVYVNWTGASEVASIAFNVLTSDAPLPDRVIPTGRPLPAKAVQIRDENGNELGPNVTGEVVILSRYMSDGYLGDAQRTRQKFGLAPDGRGTYRTGDLGRIDDHGGLELLGRLDSAVKIRGYLVEPIEVESALLDLSGVREAIVIGEQLGLGQTRLVAYVALRPNSQLSVAAIRQHLRRKLPSWMVPATVVLLEKLPKDNRGKVDRFALPVAPESRRSAKTAPRWEQEAVVLEIWEHVFGLDDVGTTDDFVELGGDSLVAEALLSEINARLGVALPSSVLIEAPTVAKLTERIYVTERCGSDSTFMPLRAGTAQSPVFCIAGGGGMALNFLNLARRLGDDYPVFGLQAHGLEKRGLPDWSIQQHARRHLANIRKTQPRGPYHLVGFSFGGLIAYEIAQRLTAAGETVALLSLLDSTLPRLAVRSTEDDKKRRGDPQTSRFDPRRLLPGYVPTLKTIRNTASLPLTGLVRPSGMKHFDTFLNQSLVLINMYRIRPYSGRTVLYLAETGSEADETSWLALLQGESVVEKISGNHNTILREPNVAALAASLTGHLRNVSATFA